MADERKFIEKLLSRLDGAMVENERALLPIRGLPDNGRFIGVGNLVNFWKGRALPASRSRWLLERLRNNPELRQENPEISAALGLPVDSFDIELGEFSRRDVPDTLGGFFLRGRDLDMEGSISEKLKERLATRQAGRGGGSDISSLIRAAEVAEFRDRVGADISEREMIAEALKGVGVNGKAN